MSRAFAFWTGGKDAHYALYRAVQAGVDCDMLLCFVDASTELIMSSRVPPELMEEQTKLVGIPMMKLRVTRDTFEREVRNTLFDLRSQGITLGIFAERAATDRRDYYRRMLADFDMRAVFPLWGIPAPLLLERERKLMRSIVVRIDRKLSESYLGREVDAEFVEYLHENGFDICGEGGEYDTFVCRSPLMDGEIFLTHAERRATPEAIGIEIDYWKVEADAEE
jgi:diphthine-ammonia ligase